MYFILFETFFMPIILKNILYVYIYFLFQFERDKKSKGNETSHSIAHTIGLEEVLSSLSSSEFHDDQVIL